MTWITLPGLTGKVYVPENTNASPKKHPCKTCLACQWCDETRCDVCRNQEFGGLDGTGSPACRRIRPEPSGDKRS